MINELKNKAFNMKQVINIEYRKRKQIDKEDEKLFVENWVIEDNFTYYTPPNIIFYFTNDTTVVKRFETDEDMFDYYEMLESRYNLIDLSKDF